LKFSDRDAEISGLRAWILRLVNVGVPEDEIAILARTPELVSDFAMSFSDTQPPFTVHPHQ
ncbi:hypothetical protein, partial [Sulfitobacter sp.]|uniref:hypothetical protein n=1 Tax=Sulfitobacter sp. TaxID=1903071 RepID=UPI003F6D335E